MTDYMAVVLFFAMAVSTLLFCAFFARIEIRLIELTFCARRIAKSLEELAEEEEEEN